MQDYFPVAEKVEFSDRYNKTVQLQGGVL